MELVTSGDVGQYTSVVIGVGGNPVIAYQDLGNVDLELYVCANAACSTGTNVELVTSGDVGLYASIAIDDGGNPVIPHFDNTNGDLKFARVKMPVTGIAYQ